MQFDQWGIYAVAELSTNRVRILHLSATQATATFKNIKKIHKFNILKKYFIRHDTCF